MEVSVVDRCSLAGDNGFQETGHHLFRTEPEPTVQSGVGVKSLQSGVGVNGENEGKVEIFLEREEVSGEWRDILVVRRGEERVKEEKKEEASVSRLRIKVIASVWLFSSVCS